MASVTGGRGIASHPGGYTAGDSTDPDIEGRAIFAFVSKYKPGASLPGGNTSFKSKAAGLSFETNAYERSVISCTRARYNGAGTVNGAQVHPRAVDGDGGAPDGPDSFRIKIRDPPPARSCTNQPGEAETPWPGR